MTPKETALLVRYIKSLCPQQAIDDYTYETWHDVIGHLGLAECRAAAAAASARTPFVAPAEIIAEVAAVRCVDLPHSNACRERSCRECRASWCSCACHPAAVTKVAGPPAARAALERREARQAGEPRRLSADDLKGIGG